MATRKAADPATKAAPAASAKGAAKAPTKAAAKDDAKAPARRRKIESPFDTKFLEQMKKLLQKERETYSHQAESLKAEADSLVASMEPGDVQFDEEGGEGDTIAVERERDLALSAKAREMVSEIDHALTKFELGTYGICEVSGEPIPRERLKAIPWARERVEFKVGGFGRR